MVKNGYFGPVLLMICLIPSCQTQAKKGDVVLENSQGYRTIENADVVKERPDWIKTEKVSSKSNGKYYFQANAEGDTLLEASQEAENEVKRQIASHILSAQVEIDKSGERTPVKKGSADEQRYIEAWIQSGASFSGSRQEDYFWERTKNGNVERIRYWVRYSITEEEITAARNRIREQNNIQKKEEEDFNKLQARLAVVLSDLDAVSFLEQDADYRKYYEELLSINAQWKELTSQKERPEYVSKANEIGAAIRYYDPTNSWRQINQENERLKIEQDIAKNESKILEDLYQGGGSGRTKEAFFSLVPSYTTLTIGSVRLQMTKLINNKEFLSFLDRTDKPDFFSRNQTQEKPAVNVSWMDAVLYCNWLSNRSGLESYYSINGNQVQPNSAKKGYRLPSREEINAGLERKIIKPEDSIGILSSETNKAYCFDPKVRGLRALDGTLSTDNIGFVVVRNDN